MSREWESAYLRMRRSEWLRKLKLALFRIGKHDLVLDLGCGDGLNMAVLDAMGVKQVVGIDKSTRLVGRAKQRRVGIGFLVGVAQTLPFKDEVFDVVLVDSVFHHFRQYEQPLGEVKRILARGGKLCFIEPHQDWRRKLYDFLTVTLPMGQWIPGIRERRTAYLLEKDTMSTWLGLEGVFLRQLGDLGFKKRFCRTHLLSVVGEFTRVR